MPSKRGDIVLVLFPDSNSVTAKRRPALVVQANSLPTQLPQVIVALITSNMTRSGASFRLAIPTRSALNRGTGLKVDSLIMFDNLTTVLDRHVHRKIGTLVDMSLADSALRTVLGI